MHTYWQVLNRRTRVLYHWRDLINWRLALAFCCLDKYYYMYATCPSVVNILKHFKNCSLKMVIITLIMCFKYLLVSNIY